MSKHWIVVADRSKARIFTVDDPHGALQEVETLDHPEGREHARDVNADRQGRAFDSSGQGRHAMGTSVEPMEQDAIRFSKEVSEHLRTACHDGRCNRLLLVAGPDFLGLLRKQLNTPPDVRVKEIDKNLCNFDAREIRSHLPDRL
jgi:protein required for attachment to host cells